MRHPDVQGATLAEAFRASQRAEAAFLRKAKTTERTPALRGRKRERRALQAIHLFRLAVFWRGLAEDYESEPSTETLISELEDGPTLSYRWDEAALRARLAARAGALAPGRQAKAVDAAAAIEPGEGELPTRPSNAYGGAG